MVRVRVRVGVRVRVRVRVNNPNHNPKPNQANLVATEHRGEEPADARGTCEQLG